MNNTYVSGKAHAALAIGQPAANFDNVASAEWEFIDIGREPEWVSDMRARQLNFVLWIVLALGATVSLVAGALSAF